MTATEAVTVCPECGSADRVDLGDGQYLCLGCRHEWNPTDPELVEAFAVQLAERAQEAAVATILGPESDGEPDTGAEAPGGSQSGPGELGGPDVPPADLTGLFVRDTLHPDRAVWLVVEDDGGRALLVQDNTGKDFPVDRATVEYLGSDPDVAQVIEADPSSPGSDPMPSVIMAVAGLALEAGVECVGEGEDPELYQPRIGWMPPPCDGVPEAEQGVAYAVAILIRHFDLEKEAVRLLASGLLIGAEEASGGESK